MIGGLSSHDQARCAEVMPNMQARLFAAKEVERYAASQGIRGQNPVEPWSVTLNSNIWRESEIASATVTVMRSCGADIRRLRSWRGRTCAPHTPLVH